MSPKWPLVARCCDGSATVAELEALYEHDREITYATFARHVDVPSVEAKLGYNKALRLKDDWHVHYYKSTFRGKPCCHLDWSAIDHVYQAIGVR